MIEPELLVSALSRHGIDFYTGVPDSLLKDFCAYVDDNSQPGHHVIAANEGNAVAVASGYNMATGRYAVVYMQNSGLGNAINPLTSIADSEVYRIPMLLVVGWRGEPDVKDEPQHVKQGRITPGQLELLDIPCRVVDAGSDPAELADWSREQLDKTSAPVALLVKSGAFSAYRSRYQPATDFTMIREAALDQLLDLAGDAAIVSTTGKTSREVFELRAARNESPRDFLTVGGMGHTASIALGLALGRPGRRIVCIDGDGSALMHLGALPVIGSLKPGNLIHVLLNNAAHESVGGQPTVADRIDLKAIALGSGYSDYALARTPAELTAGWQRLEEVLGPVMLEVQIAVGARDDLGRPTSSPRENKRVFMEWIKR